MRKVALNFTLCINMEWEETCSALASQIDEKPIMFVPRDAMVYSEVKHTKMN